MPNNDLTYVLASIGAPTIIVDAARVIRRFTPEARGLMSVSSPTGRAISDVGLTADTPALLRMIDEAVTAGLTVETEMRDGAGILRRVQVRPYRTAEGQIDGTIISLSLA